MIGVHSNDVVDDTRRNVNLSILIPILYIGNYHTQFPRVGTLREFTPSGDVIMTFCHPLFVPRLTKYPNSGLHHNVWKLFIKLYTYLQFMQSTDTPVNKYCNL